jgi:hypothetical protein
MMTLMVIVELENKFYGGLVAKVDDKKVVF